MSPRIRLVLSVLIIGHLLAVITPPLFFQTRGPAGVSPSVTTLSSLTGGYSRWLHLNRGYAFFAPDPGPTHLIGAAIGEGDRRREILIPDLDRSWSRLNYHRHLMLAEYLHATYQPPGPPPALQRDAPERAAAWTARRERYETLRRSIIEHLEAEHDAPAAIRRVEHLLPDYAAYVADPVPLDDPSLYRVLPDVPIGGAASPLPPAAPERIPLPRRRGS